MNAMFYLFYSRLQKRRTRTSALIACFALFVAANFISHSHAFAFGEGPGASNFGEQRAASTNPLRAKGRFVPNHIGAGGTSELLIEMEIEDGYHAYLDRFKLTFESPTSFKVDDLKIAPVVPFFDVISKSMKDGVEKKATLRTLIEVPSDFPQVAMTARVKLSYQACTKDFCLFPKSLALDVPFTVTSAADHGKKPVQMIVPSKPSESPSSTTSLSDFEKTLSRGLLPALAFVFLVGLATSFTPCIYPMIPITLAVIGARSKGQKKSKSVALSFVYVLGICLTYSILGILAARSGALFGSALSNVYVVTSLALIFVAMGLSMFGLYEVQPPAFIRNRIASAKVTQGYRGAFVSGLVAGVVASPCVGPVLVSILTYIAKTQNMALGFLFLFTFALGMGVLFIVIGASSSLLNHLPKAGHWMDAIKFVFGSAMLGMAFYYIKPIYPPWLFHLLFGLALILVASRFGAFEPNEKLTVQGRIRKGMMLALFYFGIFSATLGGLQKAGVSLPISTQLFGSSKSYRQLNWQPFQQALLDDAIKNKKPVIIDFYADWCAACVELEEYTFTDEKVRTLSNQFVLLKVDATTDFPGLDELKKRYQVLGLPTMIFYDRKGQQRTELTVTGFENADAFLKRMQVAQ